MDEDKTGKIQNVVDLLQELKMLAKRLNDDTIPFAYTNIVDNAVEKLDEMILAKKIDRREKKLASPRLTGRVIVGDRMHAVAIPYSLTQGLYLASSVWIKKGEIFDLEIDKSEGMETYTCVVLECRGGQRTMDDETTYYLSVRSLSH